MRSSLVGILVCGALLGTVTVLAFEDLRFESKELAERFADLTQELRCPKCLNINIAESDAPIAQDLRRAIHVQLHQGKSDTEIKEYFASRYGDFILYDPPMKPSTLALWILPAILILLGIWILLRVGFRRDPVKLTDEQKLRIRTLDES